MIHSDPAYPYSYSAKFNRIRALRVGQRPSAEPSVRNIVETTPSVTRILIEAAANVYGAYSSGTAFRPGARAPNCDGAAALRAARELWQG